MDEIVGLDIGGANLKAAIWTGPEQVHGASTNFPMWKQPGQLADGIRELVAKLPTQELSGIHLAVTMTGELADCFATRREGVAQIVDQLSHVVSPEQFSIYTIDGRWFSAAEALHDPWTVAASNWHALASWLSQWPPTAHAFDCAVLVDIGSTTVDVLPILDRRMATDARTDRDRLERFQLIYTGLRRTPVCAVVRSFALDETIVPVMAELFATTDDAYVLLGLTAEDADDLDSADGRPRTKHHAAARLARMIGEDAERLTEQQLRGMAQQVVAAQAMQIAQAITCNLKPLRSSLGSPYLICSGHGLPLFEQTIRTVEPPHRTLYLSEHVGEEASRSAPAAAVAWLRRNTHKP